jgi:hypothetical protein
MLRLGAVRPLTKITYLIQDPPRSTLDMLLDNDLANMLIQIASRGPLSSSSRSQMLERMAPVLRCGRSSSCRRSRTETYSLIVAILARVRRRDRPAGTNY